MSITEEEIEQARAKIEQGDLRGAAQIIIAKSDPDQEHVEIVEETLRAIKSPTLSKVQSIYETYQRDQNNLAKLKNALANVQDIIGPQKSSDDSVQDISELSDEQLSTNIENLRKDQGVVLAKKGSKPDMKIAQKLSTLVSEKKRRGADSTSPKKSVNKAASNRKETGVENWFVLPDDATIERIEDVTVVVGSPVTDVLRERYMKQYHMNSIQQFTKEQMKALGAEEYQDAEREISRQTEFVETYKDSERVLDRDIFVHQIAMKLNSKHYTTVPQVKSKEEKDTKIYYFISGQIAIKYDLDKKLHSVNISGNIPGRVAIAIKRRTTSGRIIDDSYAILEIHDSAPVFYAFSSKGVGALSGLDQIRRTIERSKFSLDSKEAAKLGSKSDAQRAFPSSNNGEADPIDASGASNVQTSTLREQLKNYIVSGSSKSTIQYIVQQISKEEGKSVEEINAEFNLSTKSRKKQKEDAPDLAGTEFLKDRVEDLKKSILKDKADSQEKKKTGEQ